MMTNQEVLDLEVLDQEDGKLTLPVADPGDSLMIREPDALETVAAGDITRRWLDFCHQRGVAIPPRHIKIYAKKIKELRTGGIGDEVIVRALAEQFKDGQASVPSLLDNYVTRVQSPRARAPRRLTAVDESLVRRAETPGGAAVMNEFAAMLRNTKARES